MLSSVAFAAFAVASALSVAVADELRHHPIPPLATFPNEFRVKREMLPSEINDEFESDSPEFEDFPQQSASPQIIIQGAQDRLPVMVDPQPVPWQPSPQVLVPQQPIFSQPQGPVMVGETLMPIEELEGDSIQPQPLPPADVTTLRADDGPNSLSIRPVPPPPVTCANILCAGNTICQMGPRGPTCVPRPPFPPGQSPPFPFPPGPPMSCATVRCSFGQKCVQTMVQCFRAPCPRNPPQCVSVCRDFDCPRGQECEVQRNGQPQCERERGNDFPRPGGDQNSVCRFKRCDRDEVCRPDLDCDFRRVCRWEARCAKRSRRCFPECQRGFTCIEDRGRSFCTADRFFN